MRRAILWIAIALGVASAHAQPAGKDIVIGEYLPMTGAMSSFGAATANGTALAIDERNAKGGVKKRTVRKVTLDTMGKTSDAPAVVERLIDVEKAVALLGEVTSPATLAAAAVAQNKGVPMMTPTATNEAVTRVGDMISRACLVDESQARAMAKFAVDKLGKPPVAIVHDASQAYSKGLAAAFETDYKARGGVVPMSLTYTPGTPDWKAQVDAIKKAGVRAVYVPGYYGDVALFAKALEAARVKIALLGSDAWDSPDLVKIGGGAVDGAYYTNHFTPTDPRPEVKAFVTAYRARYKAEPDALAALGYDAANLVMDAMARAPSLSGKDLAAAIRATKNFPGVTGAITIDGSGNATKPAAILRIVGGGPKHIATITP